MFSGIKHIFRKKPQTFVDAVLDCACSDEDLKWRVGAMDQFKKKGETLKKYDKDKISWKLEELEKERDELMQSRKFPSEAAKKALKLFRHKKNLQKAFKLAQERDCEF